MPSIVATTGSNRMLVISQGVVATSGVRIHFYEGLSLFWEGSSGCRATIPVETLETQPDYTSEARELTIDGEVRLEVCSQRGTGPRNQSVQGG